MNKAISNSASIEFSELVILFLAQLVRFIGYEKYKTTDLSIEKVKNIMELPHPLMLNFKNDNIKARQVTELISNSELTNNESVRLLKLCNHFKTVVLNTDTTNTEESWNYFDSGLDIFIEEVNRVLMAKDILKNEYSWRINGSQIANADKQPVNLPQLFAA
jgi:hypothetical protein